MYELVTQCSFLAFPCCQTQRAVLTPLASSRLKSLPCPQGGESTQTQSRPDPATTLTIICLHRKLC